MKATLFYVMFCATNDVKDVVQVGVVAADIVSAIKYAESHQDDMPEGKLVGVSQFRESIYVDGSIVDFE